MATRSIVTSQPDIACDVCGRRLLRGERPDVFITGGQRRNVCELCAPRAADEGWLRERDHNAVTLPPARQRRTRGLLERLRQRREPAGESSREQPPSLGASEGSSSSGAPRGRAGARAHTRAGGPFQDEDFFEHGLDDPTLAKASFVPDLPVSETRPVPAVPLDVATGPVHAVLDEGSPEGLPSAGELREEQALAVFNSGPHPRRIAGIGRSLGVPEASVRPLDDSGETAMVVVVAWELCWYRYQLDLSAEAAGASLVAEGTELSELAPEDRLGNAHMEDDGRLRLVRSERP